MKINIISNEPCFEVSSLAVAYRFINNEKWVERVPCFYIDEYMEGLKEDNIPLHYFEVVEETVIDGYVVLRFKDRFDRLWWTTYFIIRDLLSNNINMEKEISKYEQRRREIREIWELPILSPKKRNELVVEYRKLIEEEVRERNSKK